MKAKKKEVSKLKITNQEVAIDAPKGYHWMLEQGRYYLMKGDYKPHDKAVKKAKFKLATH